MMALQLIEGQTAAAQFFATLAQHEELAGLLCELLTMAPRLTAQLRQHPALIDQLIEPEFFAELPDKSRIKDGFDAVTAGSKDSTHLEERLDAIRLYARHLHFKADVHLLQDISNLGDISAMRSDLADFCLAEILQLAHDDMIRRHGDLAGTFGVIALGRLGSQEMRSQSDLDLVFIYDAPADQQSTVTSTGQRPLWTSSYFIRLAQRLVSWISVPTAQGRLYEVDTRLRPDGQSGPLTVSVDRLQRYYQDDAWDWEWLAMRRSRLICGFGPNLDKFAHALSQIQQHMPDAQRYQRAIADMRARLHTHHKEKNSQIQEKNAYISDLKTMAGGDLDIQFAQSLLDIAPEKSKKLGLSSDWLAAHKLRISQLAHWQATAFMPPIGPMDNWQTTLKTHFAKAVGTGDLTSWQEELARDAGQLDKILSEFDVLADSKPDQHHHDEK